MIGAIKPYRYISHITAISTCGLTCCLLGIQLRYINIEQSSLHGTNMQLTLLASTPLQ